MIKALPATVVVLIGALPCAAQDDTQTLPSIHLRRAFGSLTFQRPIQLTHAGDNRLFVVEQNGRIRVFENSPDHGTPEVFLDIRPKVRRSHNEEGLLSLAFHPAYSTNGFFYVYYSASDPRRGVLSRFSVSADDAGVADPDSEKVILTVEQPYGNHNGGTVLFGPDGYLYVSLGDGGSAFDPQDHGQNLSTLLGTIVRIDVDTGPGGPPYAIPDDNPFVDRPEARDEIWAYGLRNVWRMSFDRETGDLWAGDVGQNRFEEIDLITRGGNYGWRIREGNHPFKEGTPPDPMIDPVVEYPQRRGEGRSMELVGMSVTGGYVYRGRSFPRLVGVYLYGDYVTGRIWALRHAGGRVVEHRQVFDGPPRVFISSFGEDAAGELYVCSFDAPDGRGGGTGRIYRVVQEK